jgi:hypothetical protein
MGLTNLDGLRPLVRVAAGFVLAAIVLMIIAIVAAIVL